MSDSQTTLDGSTETCEFGSDIDAYFARLAEGDVPQNAATAGVAVEESFGSWREQDTVSGE